MKVQCIIGALVAIVGLNLAQETSICVDKPNLSVHADPEDCHKFIFCMAGVAHSIPCGDKYFDAQSGLCVTGSTPSCPFYELPPEGIKCTAGPAETIFIAYPNNCEKFLECFDGRLKVFKCPEGLHWSDFRERCEWPSVARCVPKEQRPTVAPGECDPYEDPWNPTSFPHPTNCTIFYKCQGGQKLEVSCEDGHHYSEETKRCEYPAVAKCATDLATGTLNRCHINDDPFNPTQYAHNSDCTKFYKCASDLRFEMNCPKGLHWNDVAKYCDYPESANCLSAQATLMDTEIGSRTLRAAALTPPVGSAPMCSGNNDELSELPGFCSQYIHCSAGLVYVRSCQKGLFWNDIDKRCDYAVNSKCIGAARTGVVPNCKDVVGNFAPNPSDCTKFYICSNGEAQVMDCPQGLHWSTAASRCEWPEIANCSVETESTLAPTEGVPTTEQSIDTTSGITTTSSGQEENTATTTPLVETEATTEEIITTIIAEGNDSNSTTEATIVTDPTIATTEEVVISTIVTEANNLTTAESTTTEITYTTTDLVTSSTTEEPYSSSTQTQATESTAAATDTTTEEVVISTIVTEANNLTTAESTTTEITYTTTSLVTASTTEEPYSSSTQAVATESTAAATADTTTEEVVISTIVTEANNLTTAESTTTEITYTTTSLVTASTTEEPYSSSTQTVATESTAAATEDTTSKYVTGELTPATEVVTAEETTAINNEPTTPADTIYTSITENTPITTTAEVVTVEETTAINNEPTTPADTIYTSITENTPITTTSENAVETSSNAPTGIETETGPLTPIIPTAYIGPINVSTNTIPSQFRNNATSQNSIPEITTISPISSINSSLTRASTPQIPLPLLHNIHRPTNILINPIPNLNCSNFTNTFHQPHPTNRNRFYECHSNGHFYEMACPEDHHWNSIINNCSIGNSPPKLTNEFILDKLCPPNADMKGSIRFDDPQNCSKYYECENGWAQSRTCPEGLYWNNVQQFCDSLDFVQCRKHTETTWYRADQRDCTIFIQSFGNLEIQTSCPSGLIWNSEIKACDSPMNVPCSIEQIVGFNICPAPSSGQHVPNLVQFPDRKDCGKFTKCSGGFAYRMQCPQNLHWNSELGHCDWPEFVRCGSNM